MISLGKRPVKLHVLPFENIDTKTKAVKTFIPKEFTSEVINQLSEHQRY